MEMAISMLFVELQMAGGVEGHSGRLSSIRPDPECNGLSQRSAGNKNCGLLAQQSGDLGFEVLDQLSFSILVVIFGFEGRSRKLLQDFPGALRVISAQEPGALAMDLFLDSWVHPGSIFQE